MGSVVKYGKYYYIRYEGPQKPDGSRDQVKKSVRMLGGSGTNHKEALALLADKEREVRLGTVVSSKQNVEEYLKHWHGEIAGSVERGTYAAYRDDIKNHLIPHLGYLGLAELRTTHIQHMVKELRKKLSPKTIKNIHGVLHKALNQAVKWGVLLVNPAAQVVLPKVQKPDIHIASREQLHQLLDALDGMGKWRLPILIAIETGMRRGEILALQHGDLLQGEVGGVTFDLLMVQRALDCHDGPVRVKGTKKDKIRPVEISASLAAELRALRGDQDDDAFLFHRLGKPLRPQRFTEAFRELQTKLGNTYTLHGLRHTHITDLLVAGIPDHIVSRRVGHSTAAFTKDRYGHLLTGMQQGAVKVTEELLKRDET